MKKIISLVLVLLLVPLVTATATHPDETSAYPLPDSKSCYWIWKYIKVHEDSWSKDNSVTYASASGFSARSLGNYAVGDYNYFDSHTTLTQYYDQRYVTASELETFNQRLDKIECQFEVGNHLQDMNNCQMQKRANRQCKTLSLNGKTYEPLC